MSRTHDVTISAFDLDRLEAELAAVTEQRDELAKTLREINSEVDAWSVKAIEQLSQLKRDIVKNVEQRDRLAEACKLLMRVIGDPNASAEDWWATEDEINVAWNSGSEALAAVKGGQNE